MIEKNDWRLMKQEKYLKNKELYHIHFNQKEKHDHDHCVFCMEKFMFYEQIGYCTTDYYHWICKTCYEDFKDMFSWKVIDENNVE